ncbi:uncharacterized protein LOC113228739 isoform X1 [Hyposmocoma kahamanoa]|uniref:uncharacterized protein LOC113228739 isoform X1 n=1 Tax=Hyposmocoma kahamanoa TaxID=1477025 RepID=UPI000E6D701C|nr:uncharacterized protein LOC113228739 isoform X1 [Hyposmocoma kahamanoa]
MAHNYLVEEIQLRAEERWILEALKNVRNQRNCLHIERLQLESLKVKLEKLLRQPGDPMATRDQRPMTAEDLQRQQQQQEIPSVPDMDDPQTSGTIAPDMCFDEQECNQVDLDLDVHRPPVLDEEYLQAGPYYESDEDSDEDDSDLQNQSVFQEMLSWMMTEVQQLSERNKIRLLQTYYADPNYVVDVSAGIAEFEDREFFSCIVSDLIRTSNLNRMRLLKGRGNSARA